MKKKSLIILLLLMCPTMSVSAEEVQKYENTTEIPTVITQADSESKSELFVNESDNYQKESNNFNPSVRKISYF